ncbi:MAG: methyltransferase [Deltaproteobacteria bacterium]|nr:methyltransferase [Deltaproteobacteria bacterium]
MTADNGNREKLKKHAEMLGLELPDRSIDMFFKFMDLVYGMESGRRLTAVPRDEAISRHILDSLQAVSFIPKENRVVDIGTGGGFPGILISIARPDLTMTLVDRSKNACRFLSLAKKELGMDRIEILQLDAKARILRTKSWNVMIGRASLKPLEMVKLANEILKPKAKLVLYLGKNTAPVFLSDREKINGFHMEEIKEYILPDDGIKRWICCIEKD